MPKKKSYKTPRAEMTEEERVAARRHAAHVAHRRHLGMPDRCTPEETARAVARVRALRHRHFMSSAQIASAADVSVATVKDVLRGNRTTQHKIKALTRTTYNSFMAVEIEAPDPLSLIPAVGTRRRLQALAAHGFPLKVMAEFLGYSNVQYTWYLSRSEEAVRWGIAQTVRDMYDKLHTANPADFGVDSSGVKRVQTGAAKKRWAPPLCWDEDTIDDPDAHPEWTGACGTTEGYGIHIRETLDGNSLPPCEACRAAVEIETPYNVRGRAKSFFFDRERFAEALKERGLNPRSLARIIDGDADHADRFYRWRDGGRSPRERSDVEAMAKALDISASELIREDRPPETWNRAMIGQGAFNPYAFKAVIESSGLSLTAIAKMCGVTSHTAVGKWMRAENSPRSKEAVAPLADHLGIDVNIFYG